MKIQTATLGYPRIGKFGHVIQDIEQSLHRRKMKNVLHIINSRNWIINILVHLIIIGW
jgi:hypothetical protein